jgi:hypothetical protein
MVYLVVGVAEIVGSPVVVAAVGVVAVTGAVAEVAVRTVVVPKVEKCFNDLSQGGTRRTDWCQPCLNCSSIGCFFLSFTDLDFVHSFSVFFSLHPTQFSRREVSHVIERPVCLVNSRRFPLCA